MGNMDMRTTISVSDFVKGLGNVKYALIRANGAADRFRRNLNPFEHPGLLFDCALSINIISDWAFHTLIDRNNLWADFTNSRFSGWVCSRSIEIAAMAEIANTVKHFKRRKPNQLVQEICTIMHLGPETGDPGELLMNALYEDGREVSGYAMQKIEVSLLISGIEMPAADLIDKAIMWWESFDPEAGPAWGRR